MDNGIRLRQTALRFGEDRSGNFAVLTGMVITTVMLAVGFAINLGQAFHVKSSLLASLDAAVTSTARDITTGVIKEADARDSIETFLKANSEGKFADANGFVLGSVVVDKTSKTVEASAYAIVDSAFPVFGYDPRVSVNSAALYSDKKVEIAMMLDNTWSMAPGFLGSKDKIGDLRNAAENAVKLALAQNRDPKNPRVRVALVPYADAVNIGDLADYASFVEKAHGPNLPPALNDPIVVSGSSRPDDCVTERKLKTGKADFSDDGPYTERKNNEGDIYHAKVNRDERILRGDGQPFCPAGELVPLTSDADKLLKTIRNYKAVGVTAGAIGIQWTYYMLSPKWRSAIKDARLGKGPAAYDSKKTTKVAILMTDGVFNTAFADVPDGSERDGAPAKAKSRSYALKLCENMRGDGIEVFTIGFDLDNVDKDGADPKVVKAMLRDCASPDTSTVQHYFETSTGPELDAAFKAIIQNTERLALTK